MLKAIDRFDLSLNLSFSTYAVPLITGEIRRFLRDDGIIKISRTIKENQNKIMLEKGCYEILQPNCTMSTGISYIRKIAALADSYGKTVNPHAYIPGTGVLQSMHMVASIPNFTWLEYPYDPPTLTPGAFQGILSEPYFVEKDGCIPLPKKPGFGIEIDEELVKKYSILH